MLTGVTGFEAEWVTLTLETYGTVADTDFPVGSTAFTSLYMTFKGDPHQVLPVSWSILDWDTSDRLKGAVEVQGSSDPAYLGQIRISYPIP